jgi:glycosyltransferase involved in cell wall biosynthesis
MPTTVPSPSPEGGRPGTGGALSVVVATRDRAEMLRGCLASLTVSLTPGDDIVVADSCSSSDDTAAVAYELSARLVRCEQPGASLARNAGWRAAAHDDIAFVDDDVRVAETWAAALRGALAAHPDAAFVTGRLSLPLGSAPVERPVAFFDHPVDVVIDRYAARDFGHGANLAVRRHALTSVAGFDELFGPGARWPAAEDLDLVDRLVSAGFVGRYEPSVEASLLEWRVRRDLVPLEWSYGIGQGARLARLWSGDRARARAVTRAVAWEDGVVDLGRCVRRGYEFGTLLAVARLAGTARGALSYLLRGRRERAASPVAR